MAMASTQPTKANTAKAHRRMAKVMGTKVAREGFCRNVPMPRREAAIYFGVLAQRSESIFFQAPAADRACHSAISSYFEIPMLSSAKDSPASAFDPESLPQRARGFWQRSQRGGRTSGTGGTRPSDLAGEPARSQRLDFFPERFQLLMLKGKLFVFAAAGFEGLPEPALGLPQTRQLCGVTSEVETNNRNARKLLRGRKQGIQRLLGALKLVQNERALNPARRPLRGNRDQGSSSLQRGQPGSRVGLHRPSNFENVGMGLEFGGNAVQPLLGGQLLAGFQQRSGGLNKDRIGRLKVFHLVPAILAPFFQMETKFCEFVSASAHFDTTTLVGQPSRLPERASRPRTPMRARRPGRQARRLPHYAHPFLWYDQDVPILQTLRCCVKHSNAGQWRLPRPGRPSVHYPRIPPHHREAEVKPPMSPSVISITVSEAVGSHRFARDSAPHPLRSARSTLP